MSEWHPDFTGREAMAKSYEERARDMRARVAENPTYFDRDLWEDEAEFAEWAAADIRSKIASGYYDRLDNGLIPRDPRRILPPLGDPPS